MKTLSKILLITSVLLSIKVQAQLALSPKKVSISDTLATKFFKMSNGAGPLKVLVSDSIGNGTWISAMLLPDSLWRQNSNGSLYLVPDVKVGIGTNAPEEKLHVMGNTLIDGGKLIFRNTGKSIFIGDYAGTNDNLNDRINVYIGESAGNSNIDGFSNVYIGNNAGNQNEHGDSNLAIGEAALATNQGSANTAIGKFALNANNSGGENVAIGNYAGFGSQGSQNFFLGSGTGEAANGNGNVFIGNEVGTYLTASNRLKIHNNNSNQPLIDGDFLSRYLKINGLLSTLNEVGIKTDAPKSSLDVNGSFGKKVFGNLASGVNDPDDSGSIWIYTLNSGNITLPDASICPNRVYTIVNKATTAMTISAYFDMTNTSSTSIASGTSIEIVSDGTNWQQIR